MEEESESFLHSDPYPVQYSTNHIVQGKSWFRMESFFSFSILQKKKF